MSTDLIPYLRVIHIVTGTFWVGANIFMALFIYPTAKTSGEAGKLFISNLVNKNKLPVWMSLSSLLTILSGIAVLIIISNYFSIGFFKSIFGISLSVGMAIALFAFFHGFFVIRPCGERLAAIGKELSNRKTSLTQEVMMEIEKLNNRIVESTTLECALLVMSMILMIVSRYI